MMKRPSPLVLLVLATLLWGGNFVIGRAVTGSMPPVALSFFRWCTALVVFFPFAWPHVKKEWRQIKQYWPIVLLMSITGVAGFNTLVYIALNHTTSINASLVNSMTPIMIYMLSFFMLKEHLNRNQMIGTLISIIGVLFIISKGSLANLLGFSFNIGDIVIIGGVICWSIYSIFVKQYAGKLPSYSTFFVTIALGIIMLVPFLIMELYNEQTQIIWTLSSILSVLYVGVFASIVAFISWNTAVAEMGANKAGIFLNLIPVFATLFAIIFIDERLAWFQITGGAFVVIGVYLSTRRPSKSRIKETAS